MDYLVSKGKISSEEKKVILQRINLTTDLKETASADIVIESVFEDIETTGIFISQQKYTIGRECLEHERDESI